MFKNLLIAIVIDLEKPETIVESFVDWICFINTSLMTKFADLDPRIRDEARSNFERAIVQNKLLFSNTNENENLDAALIMENMNMDSFLGLPLMIIANKSDSVSTTNLQASNYIQYTLRSLAVKHGASLIFSSSKQPASLKTMNNYLSYIMLQNDLVKLEPILRFESLFIPMGFDHQEDLDKEFADSKGFNLKKKGSSAPEKANANDEIEEIIEPMEFLKGLKENKILYYNPEKDNFNSEQPRKKTELNNRKSIFEKPTAKILEIIDKKKN